MTYLIGRLCARCDHRVQWLTACDSYHRGLGKLGLSEPRQLPLSSRMRDVAPLHAIQSGLSLNATLLSMQGVSKALVFKLRETGVEFRIPSAHAIMSKASCLYKHVRIQEEYGSTYIPPGLPKGHSPRLVQFLLAHSRDSNPSRRVVALTRYPEVGRRGQTGRRADGQTGRRRRGW